MSWSSWKIQCNTLTQTLDLLTRSFLRDSLNEELDVLNRNTTPAIEEKGQAEVSKHNLELLQEQIRLDILNLETHPASQKESNIEEYVSKLWSRAKNETHQIESAKTSSTTTE